MLEQKLKSCVKKNTLCGDLENNVLNQKFTEIEENLENLYFVKPRGAQIRSRVQWIEQGKKNIKYFLGLEKKLDRHEKPLIHFMMQMVL